MSRVSDKSRQQFLPSISFILTQLHEVVANINNNNSSCNYNSDLNNNFTWDMSYDYPIYDSDVSIDLEEILLAGACHQSLQGQEDIVKSPLKELDVVKSPLKELDVAKSPLKELDVAKSPLMELDVARSPLQEQDIARTPLEEQDVARSPLQEQDVARSPLQEQEDVIMSPLEQEDVTRSPLEQEDVTRSPLKQDDIVRDPPDPRPVVKWSNVSKFKIRDIPEPKNYPVHGCSPDPKFYENKISDGIKRGSEFTKGVAYREQYPTPFGSMPGYLTDMGIVKVPEKGFYGFKWGQIDNGWGWVLSTTQDTFQNRGSLRAKKGDSRDTRRKKKRKK